MFEQHIKINNDQKLLDLSEISDDKQLASIYQELRANSQKFQDIIFLKCTQQQEYKSLPNFSLIRLLIDLNYKRYMIDRIAANDPSLQEADLSAFPSGCYLEDNDIIKLIKALKNNSHLSKLNLNHIDLVVNYLPDFGKVLATNVSLQEFSYISEKIDELRIREYRLCLNNKQLQSIFLPSSDKNISIWDLQHCRFIEKNLSYITQEINRTATLDELKNFVNRIKKLSGSIGSCEGNQLASQIEDVENGKQNIFTITSTANLRNQVASLLQLDIKNENKQFFEKTHQRTLINRIASSKSLMELKKVLMSSNLVLGSSIKKQCSEWAAMIEDLEAKVNNITLVNFTSDAGLRNKIKELCKQNNHQYKPY